jgi:hypothetical protein
MATGVKPIPDGYQAVTPLLVVNDAARPPLDYCHAQARPPDELQKRMEAPANKS